MTGDRTLHVRADAVRIGASSLPVTPGVLPVATRSLHRITIDPTGLDLAHLLATLREARRSLVPDGIVGLISPPRVHGGHRLGADALDGLARSSGLEVVDSTTLRVRAHHPIADPMVSILIPGYRTTFLAETLASARAQRWPRLEILVGDDCPTEDLRDMVQAVAAEDPRVRYIGRADERGGRPNLCHLLRHAQGDYLKILNDDDLLAPTCVERMAACLTEWSHVSLVTSHRQPIDRHGLLLQDDTSTVRRVTVDSLIDGRSAAQDILWRRFNWIGEPTTTMFRARDVDVEVPFGVDDEPAASSGDIALWLKLLGRGDLVYLADTLSSRRQHPDQRSQQAEFRDIAHAGLDATFERAIELGLDVGPHYFVEHPIDLRPWWSLRARTLVAELDLDNADHHLDELAGEIDEPTTVDILRSQVALARNDAAAAVKILDEAADRDRTSAAPLKALGVALLHQGQLETAVKILWFALEKSPYDRDLNATLNALAPESHPV